MSGYRIERELYDSIGGPLYAVHMNGSTYAAFSGPSQAYAFWRGLSATARFEGWFHIEDEQGNHVTVEQNAHGHAYAVLAAKGAS
jgi:hypothetical protein